MKNFYENYSNNEKLAPMVREIGWSHNIVILEKCKDDLQREFYIRMTKIDMKYKRLKMKNLDQQFQICIEKGMGCSPFVAEAILSRCFKSLFNNVNNFNNINMRWKPRPHTFFNNSPLYPNGIPLVIFCNFIF